MIETLINPEDAPNYAKAAHSFTSDDRCYPVWFTIGDDDEEVWAETVWTFNNEPGAIDYDVCWSSEGGMFVGTVVKDHETV